MADGPFATKGSDKRSSLAEMAARAAQRSSRIPPAPNTPPSSRSPARVANRASYTPSQSYAQPSSFAPHSDVEEGSGLINLHDIARMRSLAPAVRSIEPPPVTATPASSPVQARPQLGGSRYVLGGVLVALVGIGIAYGLNSQNGSRGATESAVMERPPAANAAQLAPAVAPIAVAPAAIAPAAIAPAQVEAPVAAVPSPAPAAQNPSLVPGATKGGAAPSHAAEIATASAAHIAAKGTKAARAKANATGSIAAVAKEPKEAKEPAGQSAGAAAIAAAMAAEGVAPMAAAAPPPAAAPAAAPPPVQAKAEAPAPEPTGLQGAMKKAVGPSEPKPVAEVAPVAAPPPRGDVPELPAQGAIQGAMGASRAAARNCLQGQDAPSRATIVFASTGAVQSVSVAGPAAGTPAEACMKTAMSKMVLGPFRRPTFSFSTTISPP